MKSFRNILIILLISLLLPGSYALQNPLSLHLQSPKGPIEAGESFVLQFLVKNNASETLKNLNSQLIIPEGATVTFESSEANESFQYELAPGEEKQLVFLLRSIDDPWGPADVELHTSYESPGTDQCPAGERLDLIHSIHLDVQPKEDEDYGYDTGGPSYEENNEGKNKPKLIISKYTVEPAMPRAGESFTMTLSFLNTNYEKSCRNIKIFLTTDGAASSDNAGVASGGVFSPVGSSNTFYIDYIAPGETKEKSITFFTMPTAVSKTYTMTANFEYEDYLGNELKATELIGIPIVQISKVQVDEPVLSAMGPGGPVMVDVNFYNTGRDNLSNFMVSVEGEGFTSDQQRYFVGNFQTGSSDSFSTTLYFQTSGEYKGKIVLTYEDSTGSPHKIEKEFSGFYEQQEFPNMDNFPPIENPGNSFLSKNMLIIGGVLAVLLIGVLLFLRRKRKMKKQEELDLHEPR